MQAAPLAKFMVAFIAIKSVALGVLAALIDVAFIKALLLVVASATITGVFGVIVARIQAKADERLHTRLDYLEQRANDIGGAVGANKRSTDPNADSETPPAEAGA